MKDSTFWIWITVILAIIIITGICTLHQSKKEEDQLASDELLQKEKIASDERIALAKMKIEAKEKQEAFERNKPSKLKAFAKASAEVAGTFTGSLYNAATQS